MQNGWLWISALSLAVGCSGASNDELNNTLNGARRDAGLDTGEAAEDAAEPDAGGPDAVAQDAGIDASEPDAAEPDAAAPDAAVDAGPLDAEADAQELDAGAQLAASFDFEQGTVPASIDPGTGVLTPCPYFADYGPAGNKFGSTFLRSSTENTVTLTLHDLPAHSSLSLEFLFAAIDSLDGSGTFPSGDYFRVTIDGQLIFAETFANATPTQVQSYNPPVGVELARHQDLGFTPGTYPGSFYSDSAYNLGLDPTFQNIQHAAGDVVITFAMVGGGVQNLTDESWAIDNVRVLLGSPGT